MAKLVLEDGKTFEGTIYTSGKTFSGKIEIVYDMVGYEQVLTNAVYENSIVLFSYPMIGNYGFNKEEMKEKKVYPNCVIAKEFCEKPSNFTCNQTIKEFFEKNGVVSVCDIDTREIARYIVKNGSMQGVIFEDKIDESVIPESLKTNKSFMKIVNKISKGE